MCTMDISFKPDELQPEIAWQGGQGDVAMYDGPDLAAADLPEDQTAPEPQCMPIQLSILPLLPGYESAGTSTFLPPPPTKAVLPMENFVTSEEKITCDSHMREDEARKAFSELVSRHCCYGKSVIKEMLVKKLAASNSYHYCLETYVETRTATWEQEPYTGQLVDSPANGTPCPPWNILCTPHDTFTNEIHLIEIPHTALVLACVGCQSQGFLRCFNCLGRGFKRCINCHGSGKVWKAEPRGPRRMHSCWRCRGTGRKRCPSCGGDGRVACRTCKGYKFLKYFINLRVEFSNNPCEHLINHSDLPDDLLKNTQGYQIFQQTQPMVWPIVNHTDKELCSLSQLLISEHSKIFPSYSRIILQQQRLEAIPVTLCSYKCSEEELRFWIYGRHKALYAPRLPHRRCCVLS